MDPNKLTETVNKTLENNTIAPTLNNAQNLESSTLEIPIKKNDNSLLENPVQEPASPQEMENPIGRVPSSNEESNSQENGINPETKVDAGKQINENGELEDSSTKKTLKAVGRGAAAYFTHGESIGKDSQIVNSAPVDKTIGVVSDQLEKVPGVEAISKELDEAGIADGVNDALDAVGAAKNGDIAGTIESANKLKKDTKKLKKTIIMATIGIITPLFLTVICVCIIFGPIIGGFLDVVERDNLEDPLTGEIDDPYGDTDQEQTGSIIGTVEDFENLSDARKAIIEAAAAAVAAEVPYSYGSHPFGSGLRGIPEAGLDCAGFVQWALWTGLGGNPGRLTTQVITDKIGKDFIQISASELKPGDIGLKRLGGSTGDNYNHTGIYAGNGSWFHASSGKKTHKVVKSNYTSFTIYLRYKGVD